MVFRLSLRTRQPENPQERFMNITPQGFVLENGIRMDWHEIHAIYAECLDCVETTSRYLVFEYEYGETIEIDEDETDFDDLLAVLTERFNPQTRSIWQSLNTENASQILFQAA